MHQCSVQLVEPHSMIGVQVEHPSFVELKILPHGSVLIPLCFGSYGARHCGGCGEGGLNQARNKASRLTMESRRARIERTQFIPHFDTEIDKRL